MRTAMWITTNYSVNGVSTAKRRSSIRASSLSMTRSWQGTSYGTITTCTFSVPAVVIPLWILVDLLVLQAKGRWRIRRMNLWWAVDHSLRSRGIRTVNGAMFNCMLPNVIRVGNRSKVRNSVLWVRTGIQIALSVRGAKRYLKAAGSLSTGGKRTMKIVTLLFSSHCTELRTPPVLFFLFFFYGHPRLCSVLALVLHRPA